ncbi:MAG TPA: EAL domain-containing protein [Nitrospirae bacterium]|nr:EAL domain-containing protein [Nitrospirota bacterium]
MKLGNGAKNIFVVDDDPAIRTILGSRLKEAGYKVTLCDGDDLVDKMEQNPFDLLITGVRMPEASGVAALEYVKSNHQTAQVILLTGANEIDTAINVMKNGAFDYLEKPITQEHLLSSVQRALAHHEILERNLHLERENQGYLARLERHATEREEALRMAEKIIARAFEGIIVTDTNGIVKFVNPAFTTITGLTAQESIGRRPDILRTDKQGPDFYAKLWAILVSTGHWEGEIWNRKKDGSVYPLSVSISSIRDSDKRVTNYASFIKDISKRKKYEKEMHFRVNYDRLTRLPNRSFFKERLTHAILRAKRESQTMAALFLDIDNFKNVNDTYGHSVGDLLLKEASARLMETLRESDTVSRLGDDEFAILLEEVANEFEVKDVVCRLIDNMNKPYLLDEYEIFVSVSIGITLFSDEGDSAGAVMKSADIAITHAKKKGKNRYEFFVKEMSDRLTARLAIETGLRKALEKDELVAMYQPQVDSVTGRIQGLEALMRWRRPGFGLEPPSKFISVAEQSGLIISMGEWILREACSEVKRWHNVGFDDLLMSVNVSAKQFEKKNLVETVRLILSETNLAPHYLELEITESSIMANMDWATKIMRQLSELGVNISIDDFGTGFSSMSRLRKFPISKLKVDKSFVDDITGDNDNMAIVQATISMGHSMGLRVIAEGAETLEQVSALNDNGCSHIQGFYFSPPETPEKILELLKKHNQTERSSTWACGA